MKNKKKTNNIAKNDTLKMVAGGILILLPVLFFVIYTTGLGGAMLNWTKNEVNGAIFRQGIWAMFSVYTEMILEVILIAMGVKLIQGKTIAKWMIICFAVFFVMLICGHILYAS